MMPPGDPGAASLRFAATCDALLPGVAAMAIDIPIGLQSAGEAPRRRADVLARDYLSGRNLDGVAGVASRVFPAPTRPHLDALRSGAGYHDLAGAVPGVPKLSKQCYEICPKIREIDDLCAARPAAPVYEAHPEVSFAFLAGRTLRRKKSAAGALQRIGLLEAQGLRFAGLAEEAGALAGAGLDDVLDACVLALTADRIFGGGAFTLPDPPERDPEGRRRAIFC